jgi:peroxiredoxin
MKAVLAVCCAASLCAPLWAQLEGLRDATQVGPAPGALAAEFSLPDQSGKPRTIESLMGPHGLVLVFFRSADWCVFCKAQLMQLQRDSPLLTQAGLGLAAISYDSPGVLAEFAKRKSIQFPLLSDHDSNVIRAYGVADRKFRKGMQVDVQTEMVHAASIGNVPVYGISYPAVFVLGRDARVKWRFVSEGSELRLTGASILEQSVGATIDASRTPVPSRQVEVTATATNTAVALGNRVRIALELKIPAGFHVYAPEVGNQYIGVSWQMDPSNCIEIGAPEYPKPERKLMKSSNETLPVYENSLRISRELIVKPGVRASDPSVFRIFSELCLDPTSHITASGVLRFQACDEQQCYPPQTLPLHWKFDYVPLDRQRSPDELKREFEP